MPPNIINHNTPTKNGLTTLCVVPSLSFPSLIVPTQGRAGPIKHWRKQLFPLSEHSSNTRVGSIYSIDAPNGYIHTGNNVNNTSCVPNDAPANIATLMITTTTKHPDPVLCNRPRITSSDTVVCNRRPHIISASTIVNKKYFSDSANYLRNRKISTKTYALIDPIGASDSREYILKTKVDNANKISASFVNAFDSHIRGYVGLSYAPYCHKTKYCLSQ